MIKPSPKEFADLLAYVRASRDVSGWISGARVFALLSGALDAGVLDALRTESTPEQIAAATGIDEQNIVELCMALEAHGIVQQDGDGYQLTPDYALLASPTAAIPLADLIRYATVMVRELQAIPSSGAAYTAMPPEDVLAMAKGSGISTLSSSPHVTQDATVHMIPEVTALWEAGAHHLEVGCGIGNALFGIVTTFPKVTAVGIEIDALTTAEAERRMGILGIGNRVELRMMDACELQDVNRYDTVQWSQFFFPAATRPIVLKAMHRALKPGGYLIMPWLGWISGDTTPRRGAMLSPALRGLRSGGISFVSFLNDLLGDSRARRKRERRYASLQRLLFGRWGVPVRTLGELRSEVESNGFRVVREVPTPASPFVLTRGLLLAQREAA
jgi:SAM-dependent methyltransferase